jgi:Tfp pilus assembly protein PilZ
LIFCAVIFDVSTTRCVQLVLTPLFVIVTLSAILSGYGLHEMKQWSWYGVLASSFLIMFLNLHVALSYSESHHKGLAFLGSVLFVSVILYRLAREVKVPYFLPKIEWWESDPRYKFSVPVSIVVPSKETTAIQGEILDLSRGGCFVKTRETFIQDDIVNLTFMVMGKEITSHGVVVWITNTTVTRPKGIGVKFIELPKKDQKAVTELVQKKKRALNFLGLSKNG